MPGNAGARENWIPAIIWHFRPCGLFLVPVEILSETQPVSFWILTQIKIMQVSSWEWKSICMKRKFFCPKYRIVGKYYSMSEGVENITQKWRFCQNYWHKSFTCLVLTLKLPGGLTDLMRLSGVIYDLIQDFTNYFKWF